MPKKLKNTQGATLLMALVFLLAAALLSATVLTEATTAARLAQADRIRQQAYLSVSSAARLLRAELARTTLRVQNTQYYADGESMPYHTETRKTLDAPESLRAAWEFAMAQSPAVYRFEIRETEGDLGAVSVELTVDAQLCVTAVLQNADGPYACRLVLTVRPHAASNLVSSGSAVTETVDYAWPEANAQISGETEAAS